VHVPPTANRQPPTAADKDIAQLLHIDVDQRAGLFVFVTAIVSPVRISMCDNRFSRHRTNTACTVEPAIDSRDAMASCERRWRHRNATIRRTTGWGVRLGLRCGQLDRSTIPARPIAAYRNAQRLAVGHDTWKCSAVRAIGQPSSTTRRANNKHPRGVKTALAWTMKVSCSLR
jgi:hypothetical protein